MQIGVMLGALRDARALGALAREAEELGFDSLWMGDHIAFPAPILDPFQILACFASHTTRVRLGTCVYLLPLRHPTLVAKMVSSLDVLTAGRLIFGIGVGGEFPDEFEACGVPVSERGARTNEAISVLRSLWRNGEAVHAGRFFRVGPVALQPPPIQPGGPPIWVGGRSEAALRRTARFGDGYVGYLLSADGFRQRMARIDTLVRELEAPERAITPALMTFAVVDRQRDAAVQRAGAILSAMYGRDMQSAAARYCVAGTPEDCRAAVTAYATAGVRHLILAPLAGRDDLSEQLGALAAALNIRPISEKTDRTGSHNDG